MIINPEAIRQHRQDLKLDQIPRVKLAHTPTPMEELPNLGAALAGPNIYVKRDDCTGLALGGNKVRQLEFYLGEALEQSCDTILITGAVQSNYVRMAAAAARKLGMECHLQLEMRVPKDSHTYNYSGNVLLDKILGATIHHYPVGEDEAGADRNLEAIAENLRQQGREPYVIHLSPGHPPLGTLGYVDAAYEILIQMLEIGSTFKRIFVPSGSSHTHSGLLTGLRAFGSSIPVTGVCVRRDAASQRQRVMDRSREVCALLGIEMIVTDDDIETDDYPLAPGYGQLNKMTLEAISLTAQSEGLILDPVYTGKAMAGMIRYLRDNPIDGPVLFVHTGGTPSLFAYEENLTETFPD